MLILVAIGAIQFSEPYAAFFCCAFNFAHLARCAAAILLLPAAEIVRFGLGARPFVFAHRAFCAKLIFLRAEADRVWWELPPPNLPRTERAASTCLSWFARFVLSTINSDTMDASPFRFAMNSPLGMGL
jgi:hypothetical protein